LIKLRKALRTRIRDNPTMGEAFRIISQPITMVIITITILET
jgi:hypothetical protein